MPSQTFFNLNNEKRELIISVSTTEFADYGYTAASINRIVSSANIAKGSFYQYFSGKDDLFIYLLDIMKEKKLEFISTHSIPLEFDDMFAKLKAMYIAGLEFAAINPKFVKIGTWIINHKNHEVVENILKCNPQIFESVYIPLLEEAIKAGDIRKDVDIHLLSYLLYGLNTSLWDYYSKEKTDMDFSDESELLDLVDKMIEFIKHGIKKQEES